MPDTINIYCDESCHLEHDGIPVMVLGCVWMPAEMMAKVSCEIREIKARHCMSPKWEAKWTKISPAKTLLYLELIDYFFDTPCLHFRGVLIPDKGILNHSMFAQTHDGWYYKMMFTMLEPIIDPDKEHCVYLDIKDTRSEQKRALLEKVLFLDDTNFLYAKLDDQTNSETLQKFNLETGEEHQFFFNSEATLRFKNIVIDGNKNIIYFLSENYLYSFELITDEY